MGTGLGYMIASALYRMTRPPYLVGGMAMFWGYIKSMLTRQQRLEDTVFRTFLRSYQWSCLLRGKSLATAKLNERCATKWKPEESESC